jgi:hypothetical protein
MTLPQELRTVINRHTVVRNCFEHNDGVVRSQDTKRLGLTVIQLADDAADARNFGVGDRLVISTWDVEDITTTLAHAADILVP